MHSLMPASSCMLPANTACFGVFVLWTNREIKKTEGHIIHGYIYTVYIYTVYIYRKMICGLKEMKKFGRYSQVHSVIKKTDRILFYFVFYLCSPHTFAFCICHNNWDTLMTFKQFFQGYKLQGQRLSASRPNTKPFFAQTN